MTTDRRKSPRKAVVNIVRVGSWGNIKYVHELECGHAESRPRASRAPSLACVTCLKVERLDEEMQSFVPDGKFPNEIVDFPETMSEDEIRVEQMAATIAKRFGVPREAVGLVTVVAGRRLDVMSGYVFLSASDIKRLGEQ